MPTASDILQAGVNAQYFDTGAAAFFVQATANWSFTGFSATAFPTKIDDIVVLTGATPGAANTANGWRNIGHTGPTTISRNRTTTDLGSEQVDPVLTVHDRWEAQVETIALEASPQNIADFIQTDPAGAQSVVGGAVAQTRYDFGSPVSINYRRVAVLHPRSDGTLEAWVFAKTTVYMSQGGRYERTGRVERQVQAKAYPDDRVADVNRRVGAYFYTTTAYLT